MGMLARYPAYKLSDLLDGPDGLELMRLDRIMALAYPPETDPNDVPAEWTGGGETQWPTM